MKPRLTRPLLAALVSGALAASGAVYASPAFADPSADPSPSDSAPSSPSAPASSDSASPSPSLSDPAPSDSVSSSPSDSVSPSASDPAPPVPSVPTSPVPSTPPVDKVGPDKVNFKLNYASAWAGQAITLSQGTGDYSDPTDTDKATLKRVVSWGDGLKTTLSPTATSVNKAYGKAGKFKVTVTVTDPAGNFKTSSAATVTVTVATGKVSLSKTKVYQGAPFTVKVAKVPAGTVEYRIAWSDGYVSTHKAKVKSVTDRVLYPWVWDSVQGEWVQAGDNKLSGLRAIKISWKNAKGWSIYQQVGKINVLKDSWKPALTITKPSSPNRASSWKTIKGTATDKGSGVSYVYMSVLRVTSSGKFYCLNNKKQWKRYNNVDQLWAYCYNAGVPAKIVKGKWSVKLPAGITKNQGILVAAWIRDNADNYRDKTREANITRS